ncbi:MAG: DNA replication and repair protein RecF [Proteobacteria bacterium]|nr:DNA replication and repair protein RecF [Pseudomonadota bacterium]
MILHSLEWLDFRNLQPTRLAFDPAFNLIHGENGQGKTNLLEAAYLLVCQRSFRAARLAELLRFGSQRAIVRGELSSAGVDHTLQVELDARGRRTELDGKATRSLTHWPSGIAAVLFTTDDLLAPRGSPSDRRRLLDQAVAAVWGAYAELLRRYTRALRARNRLLRERPSGVDALLEAHEPPLATLGAKIVVARQRLLVQLLPRVRAAFARILGSAQEHDLELRYLGSALDAPLSDAAADVTREPAEPADLAARLAEGWRRERARDLTRGLTSSGPHADDLEFRLEGRPVRQHASQGQLRALVLAFKVAQILDLHGRSGEYPALLLDDVSSELDAQRNRFLHDFLAEVRCQLFLTTARPELVPWYGSAARFAVVGGAVARVALPGDAGGAGNPSDASDVSDVSDRAT